MVYPQTEREMGWSLGCLQKIEGHGYKVTRLFYNLNTCVIRPGAFADIGQLDEHIDVRQFDVAIFVSGRMAGIFSIR